MRIVFFLLSLVAVADGMERVWIRMAGQWPVEGPPLITDWNGDGKKEALLVNRGGQLMVWSLDGVAVGAGQDGMAVMLPEGRWTSTPTPLPDQRLMLASVEGTVVMLDRDFRVAWQRKLAGETAWTMGRPALFGDGRYCFGDRKGVVTCFNANGDTAWKADLGEAIRLAPLVNGRQMLVAAGRSLVALDAAGKTLWKQDAGGLLVTGPVSLGKGVVVGTDSGRLLSYAADGRLLWQTEIGQTPDYNPTVAGGVLYCRGQWGNLYAINAEGKRLWKRVFRSKSKAVVVVGDRIVLPAFDQHVYVLNLNGELVDDYRVNGAAVGVAAVGDGSSDVLALSAILTGYRLRPGTPVSPYGPVGTPRDVTAEIVERNVRISNPAGALLRVELTGADVNGAPVRSGAITRRSLLDLPIPEGHSVAVRIADAAGKELFAQSLAVPGVIESGLRSNGARVSTVLPAMPPLYAGEVDQAQFKVETPGRARITVADLKLKDGTEFAGTITLREVVETATLNGEMAADALPALGDAGLITGGATIWASIDTKGATPGDYTGRLRVTPLDRNVPPADAPFHINVLPLHLPAKAALRLCVWDYVPNKWYRDPIPALDDMARHGVNIFPRTTSIPKAKADSAGKLTMDWTVMDQELARYQGRGFLLIQLAEPPIEFAAKPDDAAKHRAQIAYLHAFRDHAAARGWPITSYAFYPIDEPGLDYGKVTLPILIEAGKLIREADPSFLIYTDPVPSLSWKDFERIAPYIDIWCPNMRLANGALSGDPRMERILKSKQVWSYECVSQVKSLSPLRYNRANAWRAKFFGFTGIGLWTHSMQEPDPWLRAKSINDEYMMMYPGDRPVPSPRWEALRDGIEDVTALEMLERAIERNRRAGTRAGIVAEAEAEARTALADVMELSDALFIESRDFLAQGDRRLWHTPADEILYARHRTRIAELTLALQ